MQRRFFLRQTTTGATAAAASPLLGLAESLRKEGASTDAVPIIDTHVSVGAWPFASVGPASDDELAESLRERGVVQAWAGSYDALLHPDLDAVNDRLAALARRDSIFLPMGAVDPAAENWERTLDRCVRVHHMKGIRLHPEFHGYSLDDGDFLELLSRAADRQILVQLDLGGTAEKAEFPPSVKRSGVSPALLLEGMGAKHRIQLLGTEGVIRSAGLYSDLGAAGAHFASRTGAETWIDSVSRESVQFGSGSPLDRGDSRLDSGSLPSDRIAAIGSHNAENLMVRV